MLNLGHTKLTYCFFPAKRDQNPFYSVLSACLFLLERHVFSFHRIGWTEDFFLRLSASWNATSSSWVGLHCVVKHFLIKEWCAYLFENQRNSGKLSTTRQSRRVNCQLVQIGFSYKKKVSECECFLLYSIVFCRIALQTQHQQAEKTCKMLDHTIRRN